MNGCSKEYWPARLYMIKAENAYMQGYKLKLQNSSYEDRLPHYRDACRYFLKAFELDREIFTLNRIREAADACWRVDDIENRDRFRDYEEEYVKNHPLENEYGDAGVVGVAEGG
jgi:hypothetical protein